MTGHPPDLAGTGETASTLGVLGAGHAAVDATCAAVVFAALRQLLVPAELALAFIVAYDAAAFALQPLFGLWADRLGDLRRFTAGGAIVAAASAVALAPMHSPVAAVVLAGVGNAVFHVGGGATILRLTPGRAWAPGLFVAPGALGLWLGILIGKSGGSPWWPAALLAGLGLAALALRPTRPVAATSAVARGLSSSRLELLVVVVLAVVALRSFVGLALVLPWRADLPLAAMVTVAVVAGKAAGGVLADRYGRMRVGVGAVLASAPLLAWAGASPAAGIVGMLLFNVTMPVTLVAVADAMPRQPGFAFGLTCLALICGALPALVLPAAKIADPVWTLALVALSALLLWYALRVQGEPRALPEEGQNPALGAVSE